MDEMKQLTLVGNETPEQAEAIGLHYEIVSAAQAAASSLLDLGRKLKRMRDSGKYKALGFETFGDYTEQAVHIRQRQAYTYISVVEKLPAQLIEENAAAGVTKLALLAKLGPQDREEVAGDLADITVTELQKLIDEKNDMAEQLSLLSAPPAAEAEAHEVDVEAELKKAADQARAEAEAKAAADMEALREQHRKALEESEAKQEERLKAARREAEKAAAEKIRQAKRDAEVYAIRREAEAADKARKAAERAQKKETAPNWKRPSRPPQKPRNRPKPCKRNWGFSKARRARSLPCCLRTYSKRRRQLWTWPTKCATVDSRNLRTNSPAHWPLRFGRWPTRPKGAKHNAAVIRARVCLHPAPACRAGWRAGRAGCRPAGGLADCSRTGQAGRCRLRRSNRRAGKAMEQDGLQTENQMGAGNRRRGANRWRAQRKKRF